MKFLKKYPQWLIYRTRQNVAWPTKWVMFWPCLTFRFHLLLFSFFNHTPEKQLQVVPWNTTHVWFSVPWYLLFSPLINTLLFAQGQLAKHYLSFTSLLEWGLLCEDFPNLTPISLYNSDAFFFMYAVYTVKPYSNMFHNNVKLDVPWLPNTYWQTGVGKNSHLPGGGCGSQAHF